jgi:hypothetical protein
MNKQLIEQAIDALHEMLTQFTKSPSSLADTNARCKAHETIAALRAERDRVAEPTHYVDAMGIVYTAKRAKFIGMALDSMTALSAYPPAQPESVRHDILEKLTYHRHERNDLTLDNCLTYLQTSGWHKVSGRTERQMVLQLTELLASQSAAQPVIDLEALNKDLIDYRDQITRLRGAIGVMAKLLDASLEVLETLDPESEEEAGNLRVLRQQIRAAIDPMVVL